MSYVKIETAQWKLCLLSNRETEDRTISDERLVMEGVVCVKGTSPFVNNNNNNNNVNKLKYV